MTEIARCPNPECRYDKMCTSSMNNVIGDATCGRTWWVVCLKCHYQGPKADREEDAIRLHNAICAAPDDGKGQPVAWMTTYRNHVCTAHQKANESGYQNFHIPLYSHSAPQGWQQGAASEIASILDGIDRTQTDNEGWWETSAGAEFGARILERIYAVLKRHQEGEA